ncbi:MAG TPA: hypothetical protein PKE66_01155 [Pyrinomonadaceae bacterium]|nr:hypothetical protein [Pyrinomonadaceae bacterium]
MNRKQNVVPRTLDLRDRLKTLMEAEIERLPALLEGLKDKERLDVILKLMPLVMPRAKPVHHTANEPSDWRPYV